MVDEEAADEADAQARFYAQRAGQPLSRRFVAEVEAVYRGLALGRFVGVNHPSVQFRLHMGVSSLGSVGAGSVVGGSVVGGSSGRSLAGRLA